MAEKRRVALIVGSDSDIPNIEPAVKMLEELGVPYELRVMSAHRTPEDVAEFVRAGEAGDVAVFIAGAGMAAHLAGVVASLTTLPVLGVPMPGGAFDGHDALLSTVQMPGGVPVATFAVGKSGATNAAIFAASIIAHADAELATKLRELRQSQRKKVMEKDAANRRRGG